MSSSLLVQLPGSWEHLLAAKASGSGGTLELRIAGRVKILKEGSMELTFSPRSFQTLSENSPSRRSAGVLVRDMSTSGVGFLFHEQLFPKERVAIQIHGHSICATIVRCKYVGPKCFEHGAIVQSVKKLASDQEH